MTDPIADLLTRIRNALLTRRRVVEVPYSRLKHTLCELLAQEQWIASCSVRSEQPIKVIEIHLRYDEKGLPVLTTLRRISSPGRRVYVGSSNLPNIRGGFGTAILSTPKGLMTHRQARKEHVGGELLCEVY